MKIYKLEDMTRGWFLGNFNPSVFQTEMFEVGVLFHEKDSKWEPHFHKLAIEINVLLEGKMKIQDKIIEKGEIFVLEPWEIADPVFLEDCKVLVVKTPSVPTDKYNIGNIK